MHLKESKPPRKDLRAKRVAGIRYAMITLLLGGTWSSSILRAMPTVAEPSASPMAQQKPRIELLLSTEKQIVRQNILGKAVKTWQGFEAKTVMAQPGDILRFTLKATNQGDRPANKLTLVQPIPKGTIYMLNTATAEVPANIDYSIDGSKTFVAQPTVKMALPNGKMEARPAPAEAYTHVRWIFGQAVAPKATGKVFYQVKVKP
jgi:uncharacterized repeat protein (TIGR01451 family)